MDTGMLHTTHLKHENQVQAIRGQAKDEREQPWGRIMLNERSLSS
jgi:hypothetical protein